MTEAKPTKSRRMTFQPLSTETWDDFERLFGPRGACAGCWCMFWRLPRKVWEQQKGEANRRAMREIVEQGGIPGVLAFDGDEAVGWCAVAPRGAYPGLARSRVLKPIDDLECWSVSCLFVRRDYRKQGVSTELLKHVCEFVAQQGGTMVEGYPVEPRRGEIPAAFAWTGIPAAFLRAGFEEVARRSPTRPIMRRAVGRGRRSRFHRAGSGS